jgi:hypothetical protein
MSAYLMSSAFNPILYWEHCYNFLALNLISYTSFSDVFDFFQVYALYWLGIVAAVLFLKVKFIHLLLVKSLSIYTYSSSVCPDYAIDQVPLPLGGVLKGKKDI